MLSYSESLVGSRRLVGIKSLFLWDCDNIFSPEVLQLVPAVARQIWGAVLQVSLWAIWEEGNKFFMEKKQWSLLEVLSNIQEFSHLWLSSRKPNAVGSWNAWVLSPLDACALHPFRSLFY